MPDIEKRTPAEDCVVVFSNPDAAIKATARKVLKGYFATRRPTDHDTDKANVAARVLWVK